MPVCGKQHKYTYDILMVSPRDVAFDVDVGGGEFTREHLMQMEGFADRVMQLLSLLKANEGVFVFVNVSPERVPTSPFFRLMMALKPHTAVRARVVNTRRRCTTLIAAGYLRKTLNTARV